MSHTAAIAALYGTESDLEKVADGSASIALRLAAALLAMGTLDRIQNSYNQAQARSMITNRVIRGSDRDMMDAQVAGPLRHTRAPMLVAPDMSQGAYPGIGVYPGMPVGMDEGMVRLAAVAAQVGVDLAAQESVAHRVKTAFGVMQGVSALGKGVRTGVQHAGNVAQGALARGASQVHGAVSNVAQSAERGVLRAQQGAASAAGAVAAAPGRVNQAVGGFLAQQGAKAELAGARMANPRAFEVLSPEARRVAAQQRLGRIQQSRAVPRIEPPNSPPGQVQQAPAPAAAPGHPATESAPVAAGSSTAAQAAPQQATAGAPPKDKGFDLGGFIDKSVGTPGRALRTVGGLAATGALAYGASKLLGKGLQVMSEENQPADWGSTSAGAPRLSFGVNQYGYAQPGSPFVG